MSDLSDLISMINGADRYTFDFDVPIEHVRNANGIGYAKTSRQQQYYNHKRLESKRLLKEMGAYQYGKLPLQRTLIANVRTCIMMEANKGKSSACKKEAKLKIYRFCKDKNVSQVLREFPWIKLPMKQRIFSLFMFIKAKEILYILANLQNYYKERRKNA